MDVLVYMDDVRPARLTKVIFAKLREEILLLSVGFMRYRVPCAMKPSKPMTWCVDRLSVYADKYNF